MSNVLYPYRLKFPRTGDWYDAKGGMWYRLSTWCDECIGKGDWEYYWEEFVFEREEDYMLFKLKWDHHDG